MHFVFNTEYIFQSNSNNCNILNVNGLKNWTFLKEHIKNTIQNNLHCYNKRKYFVQFMFCHCYRQSGWLNGETSYHLPHIKVRRNSLVSCLVSASYVITPALAGHQLSVRLNDHCVEIFDSFILQNTGIHHCSYSTSS